MKNKKLMVVQIIALILLVISVILNIFLPVHFYNQGKAYNNKRIYAINKIAFAGSCLHELEEYNTRKNQPNFIYAEEREVFIESVNHLESNRLPKREIYTKDELKRFDDLNEIDDDQKELSTASTSYFEEKSESWNEEYFTFERKRDSAKKAKIISLCVLTPITCVLIAGNLILILNCKKKKQDSV